MQWINKFNIRFKFAIKALTCLFLSMSIFTAIAEAAVSDGFDYPVYRSTSTTHYVTQINDGDGYYNAQDFGVNRHLGEDWNGEGGGNTDLGVPVYAVSNGVVATSKFYSASWGNVIIIKHQLADGTFVESQYAHLKTRLVSTANTVVRGQQIGTIGNTGTAAPLAHLHFEIRTTPTNLAGFGYSSNLTGMTDPSNYIDAHRPGATIIDFWKKASPLYATNGSGTINFDAQFKVKNTSAKSLVVDDMAIAFHNQNGAMIFDCWRKGRPTTIASNGVAQTGFQTCAVFNSGDYLLAAKLKVNGVWTTYQTQAVTILPSKVVPVTVTRVIVTGATAFNENSSTQYTATASWSNGTSSNVTNLATWSEFSTSTTISQGRLTAGTVTVDQSILIRTSYKGKIGIKTVTVKNIVIDSPPVFSPQPILLGQVTIPRLIHFSGFVQDDIGISTLSMYVIRPDGTLWQSAPANGNNAKTVNLSAYTFSSSGQQYSAGVGTYIVWIQATDTTGKFINSVKRTVIVKLADTTPPVITLTGAATVQVNQGSVYIDQGATALDKVDGNLTRSMTATNMVNTSVLGIYTVTYNVSDLSTNAATPMVRTVIVAAAPIVPIKRIANQVGLYAPSTSIFYMRNAAGALHSNFLFGAGGLGWMAITGDWNGDGFSDVGLYAPSTSIFYLRDSVTGNLIGNFLFGAGGLGWVPIVGDWDGDGKTDVGLYDPATSIFYLRNAAGGLHANFLFGGGGLGWMPITGDWNGDGKDAVALYDPTHSVFYLRNATTGGLIKAPFLFGAGGLGWLPIVGDWNADGKDAIGLYTPDTSVFYLRNSNTGGVVSSFLFGAGGLGWKPLAWGGR